MSRDGAATTFLDGENKRVFDISHETDTTLQIIGFTITASNGGEDDGSGAVVKIQGYQLWNNMQSTYITSGVTFKNCVFTMFDSGYLEAASDWEQGAFYIDISNTVFDNCEFTNITVDNPSSSNNSWGGAVLFKGCTLLFNRSKLTNITLKKTGQVGGNISGAVLAVDSYGSADVTLVNTIVANNSLSYASNPNFYPSGGVISYNSGSGHLKLINRI